MPLVVRAGKGTEAGPANFGRLITEGVDVETGDARPTCVEGTDGADDAGGAGDAEGGAGGGAEFVADADGGAEAVMLGLAAEVVIPGLAAPFIGAERTSCEAFCSCCRFWCGGGHASHV